MLSRSENISNDCITNIVMEWNAIKQFLTLAADRTSHNQNLLIYVRNELFLLYSSILSN